MSTPEVSHPWISMTPPRDVRDDDCGSVALSGHVATMADVATANAPPYTAPNPASHAPDGVGDGLDCGDDTGWPDAFSGARSLLALARKPRQYQRANIEPMPALPPRARKPPVKIEDELHEEMIVSQPQVINKPPQPGPLHIVGSHHQLRNRKPRPKPYDAATNDDGSDYDTGKARYKARKRLSLKAPTKPAPPVRAAGPAVPPLRQGTSPLTDIDESWHWDPFASLTPEMKATRGGFMKVLDAYRSLQPYPTPEELKAAHKEVTDFHRNNPREKLHGLSAESAAIFLASSSSCNKLPNSTYACPCDATCPETQANFLGLRRHILAHSLFHLHCMAKDPKTGQQCRNVVLGGRTSALIRHLKQRHKWEQWQLEHFKLSDGYRCWPQWACFLEHEEGEFANRMQPKGRRK